VDRGHHSGCDHEYHHRASPNSLFGPFRLEAMRPPNLR